MAQPTALKKTLSAALYYARKRRKARWLAQFPTSDPGVAGMEWNDNGIIKTSEG